MLLLGHDIRDTIRLDGQGRVGVFKLSNWVERTTNDVEKRKKEQAQNMK